MLYNKSLKKLKNKLFCETPYRYNCSQLEFASVAHAVCHKLLQGV